MQHKTHSADSLMGFVYVLHVLFWVECNCQDNGLANLHLPLTQQMYVHTHKQQSQKSQTDPSV